MAVLTARPELFRDLRLEGEIPTTTELITNGTYRFYLGPWLRRELPFFSEIEIRDSIVDSIEIAVNTTFSLEQVLDVFGTPDWIQLDMIGCWTPILVLGYQEPLLTIALVPPESREEFCHDDACYISSIRQDLIVSGMNYYSPAAAQALISGFDMPTQPAFRYYNANERDVPLETWNMWLRGEVDMTCRAAWEQLSEPVFDLIPTPIPVQSAE